MNRIQTEQLLQAEAAWTQAFLELDVAALAEMMAVEYTQVNDRGALVDKAGVLASLRSGQRMWERATSDEHVVRIYGDCAVVIGRWVAKGSNHGITFDYAARYVAVWVWRDARWQMVSDQSTEIGSDE